MRGEWRNLPPSRALGALPPVPVVHGVQCTRTHANAVRGQPVRHMVQAGGRCLTFGDACGISRCRRRHTGITRHRTDCRHQRAAWYHFWCVNVQILVTARMTSRTLTWPVALFFPPRQLLGGFKFKSGLPLNQTARATRLRSSTHAVASVDGGDWEGEGEGAGISGPSLGRGAKSSSVLDSNPSKSNSRPARSESSAGGVTCNT